MADFILLDMRRIRPDFDAGVIKAADYATISQAQQFLDEARRTAAGIIREAESVFDAEKQRGYQEGLRKAGQEMAEKIAATALRSQRFYRDLGEETINLVMGVVRKVLQDLEPQALITAQVKKALAAFRGCRQVTLKVNPALADTLNQKLSEITADSACTGLIHVKAVPGLACSDVIMESENGIVEASMEVQLAAITEAFRKELDLTGCTASEPR